MITKFSVSINTVLNVVKRWLDSSELGFCSAGWLEEQWATMFRIIQASSSWCDGIHTKMSYWTGRIGVGDVADNRSWEMLLCDSQWV